MTPRSILPLVALALLTAPVSAHAEKTVQRKDLPAAVEKTLAREIEGATLKGISSEACEGKSKGTCYELETMRGDKSRDLIVDSSGAVLEVEEAMALSDIPEAVKASAAKSGGKVLKAEKVTRGADVSYELVVEKAGKKSEHAFLADGTAKK